MCLFPCGETSLTSERVFAHVARGRLAAEVAVAVHCMTSSSIFSV